MSFDCVKINKKPRSIIIKGAWQIMAPAVRKTLSEKEFNDKFKLSEFHLSQHRIASVAGTLFYKAMPKMLKATAGVSAVSFVSGAMEIGGSFIGSTQTSGIITLSAGLSLYVVSKFGEQKSVDTFNKMFDCGAENFLKKKMGKPLTKPHANYSRPLLKEFFRKGTRDIGFDAKESAKKMLSIVFPALKNIETLVEQDSEERAMFLTHIMCELGNDNSPAARRIKEESVFNIDEVKAFMEDSKLFSDFFANQRDVLKNFGTQLLNSLGTDAEFIIKDFNDYNKGKKDWFSLELKGLERAIQKVQLENVHYELATRIIDTGLYLRDRGGDISGPELYHLSDQFYDFDNLKHCPNHKDDFTRLIDFANSFASSMNRNPESMPKLTNIALKKLGHPGELDFDIAPSDQKSRDEMIYEVYKAILPANHHLDATFENHYVNSCLDVIRERIISNESKNLTPEKLSNLSDDELQQKVEDYGLSSIDDLNAYDVADTVVQRIKARAIFNSVDLTNSRKIRKEPTLSL